MLRCFFVSDLHGRLERYRALLAAVRAQRPQALFIGGDLLPSPMAPFRLDGTPADFLADFLLPQLAALRDELGDAYPRIFVILGNDDGKFEEEAMIQAELEGYWRYLHMGRALLDDFEVYGYAYVPPTPFQLKDWERYDVSRFVDPGCLSPEEGRHSTPVTEQETRYATIKDDLERLTARADLSWAIFLFHAPPYKTALDRAALDGKMIDHAPLDVHVGSIAVERFIRARQPLLTLHGHVHETARLTGQWREEIGRTHAFTAAHDGPELALVTFDPADLPRAERVLL